MDDDTVCHRCVGEPYLAKLIREGESEECSFCGKTSNCRSLDWLANRMHSVMEEHFVRTSTEPDMSWEAIKEFGWERGGDEVGYVIADLLCVDTEIAEAVRSNLDDRFYDHEEAQMGMESCYDEFAQYEETGVDDSEFWNDWHDLVESLKTQSRYFNSKAEQVFARIFDGLDEMSPKVSHSVIQYAGVGTEIPHLFRARILSRSEIDEAEVSRAESGTPAITVSLRRTNESARNSGVLRCNGLGNGHYRGASTSWKRCPDRTL
jgi:hypothetical protein